MRTFIKEYAVTGNGTYAATRAGYAQPAARAADALKRPEIVEAVRREQITRLNNELLPLAVQAVERLLLDAKTPAGAVVQAAKLVFDRTLGAQDGGQRKDPSEMTGEELQQAIEQLRREAAERARPILEAEPVKQDVMG